MGRAVVACLALCLLLAGPAQSHVCGPSAITVAVGEEVTWQISADLTETTTDYVPSQAGDAAAAEIAPSEPFSAHHGTFTIRGTAPGTTTLTTNWSYPPNDAAGTCTVEITVVAASAPGGDDGEMTKPPAEGDGIPSGRLSTYQGAANAIRPRFLRQMIDFYIPAEAQKLLVLAQCFGGDLACSPHFRDMPNTAIASGTSPGQQAKYGGYHDDAARALRPGEGRTAQDVHDAGTAGSYEHYMPDGSQPDAADERNWTEMPITEGALSLAEFSLAHTSVDGEVQSRHVVFYAGKPESTREPVEDVDGVTVPTYEAYLEVQQGETYEERQADSRAVGDVQDRDAIEASFAGEPNTEVVTVGGPPAPGDPSSGEDGWDHPGTLDGLEEALKRVGEAIRNSENPDREQFIFFVSDHGEGELFSNRVAAEAPPNTRSTLHPELPSFAADALILEQMRIDVDNEPAFSLLLDYGTAPKPLGDDSGARLFAPGSFALEVMPAAGEGVVLDTFVEQALDLDGDGLVGSSEGEGISLRFPVGEALFLDRLVGQPLEIALVNGTDEAVVVTEIGQLSGAIGGLQGPDGNAPVPTAVTGAGATAPSPDVPVLETVHPNPFNDAAVIAYRLPRAARVELAVFSATGQRVRTLVSGRRPAGSQTAAWDGRTAGGRPAGSGTYFVRLHVGDFRSIQRLTLLK